MTLKVKGLKFDDIFNRIKLHYDAQGLVPAIVQDAVSKEVLMLAYMNSESLQRTIKRVKLGFGAVLVKSFGTKGQLLVIRKK